VGRRVLESVGPYARELGGERAIEEIERILREGNGADEQRRIHSVRGMAGLLDHLAEPAL
jgi:carboxylate-amine ligase